MLSANWRTLFSIGSRDRHEPGVTSRLTAQFVTAIYDDCDSPNSNAGQIHFVKRQRGLDGRFTSTPPRCRSRAAR